MTFIQSVISLANEILTFYLPIFFTFKFLASHDPQKIAKNLKFWCVLSLTYVLQFLLSYILAENLDIVLDLALHVLLIYDEFTFSEKIYDTIVQPFYKNNETTINDLSKKIQQYFEKKAEQVQSQVAQSATDKIRGFVGEILVGTLNPGNKSGKFKEGSSNNEQKDELQEKEEEDDD